ncbi:hypothetical protein SLURMMXVI_140001 [Escherichia phage vB_Eco_SLUR25]|nr:hypothetical protein SLURMMXVI_140001 [Escherichia phage vB_Eco_SLUR25]
MLTMTVYRNITDNDHFIGVFRPILKRLKQTSNIYIITAKPRCISFRYTLRSFLQPWAQNRANFNLG